ncbi:MAG TPA: hypothetical protein RMH99_30700 [Sandaracinaceae bacterium LLY-WYZ-13_1]|nr:hypothetical protein [Sandaracinaceae bacterium LLY-WYZ-13_1]
MSEEHRYASREAFALRPPTAEAAMEDPFGKTALDPPRVLDLSGSPPDSVRGLAGDAEERGVSRTPVAPLKTSRGPWPWLALTAIAVVGGLLGAVVGVWLALEVG